MPLDPVLVADVKSWLSKAANDLHAASVDIVAKPPLLEDALFHTQQAVEKAFKAFLTFHDTPFRKTHNLEELGAACLRIDPSLQNIVDDVVPLSEYAWLYRYPGPAEPPTTDDARRARELVERVYQVILDRIPVEAHP